MLPQDHAMGARNRKDQTTRILLVEAAYVIWKIHCNMRE
jgi:hypothetical protein